VSENLHPVPEPTVSGQSDLLSRNVERFRGGLAFKALMLLCHSTLGSSVTNTKKVNQTILFRWARNYFQRKMHETKTTLKMDWGQIFSQSAPDATSSRWHFMAVD